MNDIRVIKALSDPTRLQIMKWLKDPVRHFSELTTISVELGVCCGAVQQKVGLSQPTISRHLALLEQANLVIATKDKQWTFYKRNSDFISHFLKSLETEI